MPKHTSVEIIRTDLLNHPAVKAWSELRRECVEPERIEILKERRKHNKRKGKSTVYRLEGVGPGGSAIIAKGCRQATAVIERSIYEEVLPHLPVTALRYYGFIKGQGQFCWLFIEDAGDRKYWKHSPYLPEHRTIVAEWLGLMHTSASLVDAASRLPDRGPAHYLELLRSARNTILQNLANPHLTSDDLVVLKSIVSKLEVVESHWKEVEKFCDGIPRTLVHGDFVGKNVRLRVNPTGIIVLPLDWETAGWGVPAPDLAYADITAYWSLVRRQWPNLDLKATARLAKVGKMFYYIASIKWTAGNLAYEWVERPMRKMRLYASWMADAIQEAGWWN